MLAIPDTARIYVCVRTCVFVCVCVCVCLQADTESHIGLPAFTGTLRTIPRDIRVGYVTAIPKFNTILNAEIQNLKKTGVIHNWPWTFPWSVGPQLL